MRRKANCNSSFQHPVKTKTNLITHRRRESIAHVTRRHAPCLGHCFSRRRRRLREGETVSGWCSGDVTLTAAAWQHKRQRAQLPVVVRLFAGWRVLHSCSHCALLCQASVYHRSCHFRNFIILSQAVRAPPKQTATLHFNTQ